MLAPVSSYSMIWRLRILLFLAALIIWLAIQIRIIDYHSDPPLQLAYALLGCAIAVLCVLSGRDRQAG